MVRLRGRFRMMWCWLRVEGMVWVLGTVLGAKSGVSSQVGDFVVGK